MSTMQAVVLTGERTVEVQKVGRPGELSPTDALVRIDLAAICGTDLHVYERTMPVETGVIMGHEFVGTVEAVGSAVRQFEPGDRVAGSCVASCGNCRSCRRGHSAVCADMRVYGLGAGFGDLPGVHAQFAVAPFADGSLRRITDASKAEDMLFVGDILTTAYEAVRQSFRPGDAVAVVGAGPVGLCAVMSAKAIGAGTIAVLDTVPERLALAEKLGATPVDVSREDAVDAVFDLTGRRGADVVVEAVGSPAALSSACKVVAVGGQIALPGAHLEPSLELPLGELWIKQVSVKGGVCNVVNYIDEVIALVEAGALKPSAIISHRIPLSEAADAYDLFARREAVKVVLDPSK
ncbi:alcohol dehydrogenase catalytic domain-containing protein [Streptomyces sp. NPDC005799]|uniref:zinc-dependent alcohol dehydrogenase n=1 Tax=Streptomyces sp. NPDC005799 TaxID=3154678 RepID=UPI0033ED8142